MKKQTKKNKKKNNVPIERIVLGVIATAGLMAALAIAPGAGPALRLFGVGKRKYSKKYIYNTISRMKQKGYITHEEKNGKKYVRLTKKGEKRLEAYQLKNIKPHKQQEWDGKIRVVIFDIPEKMRRIRDHIRTELDNVGFHRLQDSVWVYPYPCEEFVKLLKADQRIGKNVIYMVVDEFEYYGDIRKRLNID